MVLFSAISITFLLTVVCFVIFPPLPRLSRRLSPYDSVVRVRLQGNLRKQEIRSLSTSTGLGILVEFLKPLFEQISKLVSKIAELDNDEEVAMKFQQAGIKDSVKKYKIDLVKRLILSICVGIILGSATNSLLGMIFFPIIGVFITFAKSKAHIDRRIETRSQQIRQELYTVNQLLALHVRTGSGVSQALLKISQRTHGVVSDEISNVVNRVRSGASIEEALYQAAKTSPEPHAKRTYNLLAAASQRGVDLTAGLLDLSKDLRRSIREEIKANSAKKRAAMLLPTIGILAPIMLLFVAAPIPSIVLGGN